VVEGAGSSERVVAFLLAMGVDAEEVERAAAEDRLDLLVVDQVLFPADHHYTLPELAELAGLGVAELRRLWLALGLPDVDDGAPVFTDADVEAATTFHGLVLLRMLDDEAAIQLARVIGSAMARIAEAEIGASPVARGEAGSAEMAELFALSADATLPSIARLLEYTWRRHLRTAARRAMLAPGQGRLGHGEVPLTVGFADLVGFTRLSQEIAGSDLAEVIGRFEALAHDTVTRNGGRVVKTIGDEVMWVVPEPAAGAQIALGVAEGCARDELVSDVRVGLAHGQVLSRDGDCYGPVVNLASRVVGIARPGTVLVSQEVRDALAGEEDLVFSALRRPRALKDVGRVHLHRLSRVGGD
jgi:adenylate cyclase